MNKEKTTSTDMEELKKKWLEVRKRNSGLSDEGFEVHEKRKALEVFDFFASHLSNKSELKKEAVRGFAKWYNNMLIDCKVKYKGVQLIISDNIVGQFLSSNEKEESENQ